MSAGSIVVGLIRQVKIKDPNADQNRRQDGENEKQALFKPKLMYNKQMELDQKLDKKGQKQSCNEDSKTKYTKKAKIKSNIEKPKVQIQKQT